MSDEGLQVLEEIYGCEGKAGSAHKQGLFQYRFIRFNTDYADIFISLNGTSVVFIKRKQIPTQSPVVPSEDTAQWHSGTPQWNNIIYHNMK